MLTTLSMALVLLSWPALAQAADAQVAEAINLTAILLAIITGLFGVAKILTEYWVARRIKDQRLAELLDAAIGNSLGVLQQVASGAVMRLDPRLRLPPDYVKYAPAISYVLAHAGEAADRFGVTPEKIAEKIVSRIGLAEIQTNMAVTASPATAAVVPPLAPSGAEPTASQLNREELARINGAHA